jgi:hypothetical protein
MSNSTRDTTDVKDDFLRLAKAAERLDDVLIWGPGKQRFNFLSSTDAEIVQQDGQAHGDDPFWRGAGETLLRHVALIDKFPEGGGL